MSFLEPHSSRSYSAISPVPGRASLFPWLGSRFGEHFSPVAHAVKLLFWVILVAVPAGLTGIAFRLSVAWANHFRAAHPDLIWCLPIGGLAIAFLYRFCRISHRGEMDSISEAIQVSESEKTGSSHVSPLLVPLVFVASLISHLFGASVGCEGASILLGGGVGAQCARFFRVSGKDFGTLVFCAMASAFSPLLGTPFAATVFVLERSRSRRYILFFPCLVASLIAFSLAEMLGLEPLRWELSGTPEMRLSSVFPVLGLVLASLTVGVFFRWALRTVSSLVDRFIVNRYCAMSVGGVVLLFLTLGIGTQDYSGTGIPVIFRAFDGSVTQSAFFWKVVLTALALGVGFKGGQIVPAFFVGAVLGSALAPAFGLEASFSAALGMITVFAVVVRCPISAFLLAAEIFGFVALGWFGGAVMVVAFYLFTSRMKVLLESLSWYENFFGFGK